MALFFSARDPIHNEFEDIVDSFAAPSLFKNTMFSKSAGGKTGRGTNWPAFARLDLTETDASYVLHADVPGLSKEQVDVSVKDDIVTISGERKANSEIKDEHKHVIERSYGKFTRSVRLPQDADLNAMSAKLENGVLELTVGKGKPEPSVKKVTIS